MRNRASGILAAMLLLLLAGAALAADFQDSLTFAWEQATGDLPNLAKWRLHVRGSAGGADAALIDIPYTSGAGPTFTTSQTFTVTGTPGATVRRWFVADAVSKNGNASGPSNEIFYDFQIPFADVTTPIELKITATMRPQ